MIPATEALERLKEGKRRFASDSHNPSALTTQANRDTVLREQKPFATILGCSDSRVPAEIVFDQGIGDLFVIRVAGNIAATSQIGSVEYAAEAVGVNLVVVLGHSNCGAEMTALDEVGRKADSESPHLGSIVDRIRPAVEHLCRGDLDGDPATLLDQAVRANIRDAVEALKHDSDIIRRRIEHDGLVVVGAKYSLSTGSWNFLTTQTDDAHDARANSALTRATPLG